MSYCPKQKYPIRAPGIRVAYCLRAIETLWCDSNFRYIIANINAENCAIKKLT
jgi:hypothetical protein